ncbi:MAG: hypothetical protein A2X12_08820 [Bacteroidetes bacterium GWE2_29_8]|nr:MAG: hypothetical protein A2X12_08820 [Bacteroidetes bacterium GWE2_29_8]
MGGYYNMGVIFRFNPSNSNYTRLVTFGGGTRGAEPTGSLLEESEGMLYGMTSRGGTTGDGVLFKYDISSSSYTEELNFNQTRGIMPWGSLIKTADNILYGMTYSGGTNYRGVIFQYNTSNYQYTIKFNFDGLNGSWPIGSLIKATDGNLYGVTSGGGFYGEGNIFKYDFTTCTTIYSFNGTDGIYPYSSLVQASNENLYGMTSGDNNTVGVLFECDLSGNYIKKIDFQGTNGGLPRYSSLIEVNPCPANAGDDQTICPGSSATLTSASASASSYTWSTSASSQSINVTPTTTTTYSLTVDNSGCTASDNVVVTVGTPPANAGVDQTVCPGSSATLTSASATSYTWSTTESTQSITVTPTATTTYSLTVDNSGCTASDNVVVTVSIPTANAFYDQTICLGSSAILISASASSYTWSTTESTQYIYVEPTENTTYALTVTNSDGCTASDQVVVTIGIPPANAGADQTVCSGSSTTLTSASATSYTWSTTESTQSINVTPTATTTYSLTVDNSGCTASDDVVVTVVNPIAEAGLFYYSGGSPFIDPASPKTVVTGQDIAISSSNDNCSYSWSTGATTKSIKPAPAATTTYTLTINENGCTSSDAIVINVALISGTCGQVSPSVTDITVKGAQISWNPVDNATGFLMKYKISPSGTYSWANITSLENMKELITLAQATTYEFQVRTFCVGGYYSDYTTAQFFTTNTCETPTGLTTSNVTKTSAQLSWNSMPEADRYLLRWGISGGAWHYIWINEPTHTQQIGCVSCDPNDMLIPNTTYDWQIRTFCDVSETYYSNFSSIESFVTLPLKKNLNSNIITKDNQDDFSVNLYPNPTNSNATIDLSIPQDTYLKIELYDILGSKVADIYSGNASQGSSKYTVNTLGLSPNTYIIKIVADKNTSHQQLIITE